MLVLYGFKDINLDYLFFTSSQSLVGILQSHTPTNQRIFGDILIAMQSYFISIHYFARLSVDILYNHQKYYFCLN